MCYVNTVLWTSPPTQCLTVRSCHIRKWIMLTYGWKQRWIGLLCNAMKNHTLQERRGAEAVPLSPCWQVCSVTWQLSISMINVVVLRLSFTKLKGWVAPLLQGQTDEWKNAKPKSVWKTLDLQIGNWLRIKLITNLNLTQRLINKYIFHIIFFPSFCSCDQPLC